MPNDEIFSPCPMDSPTSQDVSERLAPISNGPRVSTAQYATSLLTNGRGRDTRQMTLKALSMVSIIDSAVTASSTIPTAVRRVALSANCCIYCVMMIPAFSGIRLLSR